VSELVKIPDRGTPITADQLVRLERQVAEHIGEVEDIDTLNEWKRQSRALEQYLRDREMQGPMLGIQRRAEARIGQLLGPTSPGQRSELTLGHDLRLIKPDDRADFRVLARGLTEIELTDGEWQKSRRALVSLIRNRTGDLPKAPPLPKGLYRTVVADPPWQLDTGPDSFGTVGERGHDALAYEQMSVERIKALPVVERVADDAHLYLWTTNRYVEQAYEVARAWGFKPSVLLVWAKTPRGVGLGDAFKLTTEFIVYARRGSLKENTISETTWFNWPRGTHSTKPDDFYELVERISPSNGSDRLEMFARRQRDGWVTWGDEAGG
jgi:N6-adenosine-specific RNA methylase IME4